ncbi:DUF3750 domain-containing protein [Arenibaculum pallidiluteum]|uniref:DUF3750 domain-containing protein n=1 Tax=Arenibaculum pallidiluteum TaxID=2812559 RepID=UPI001A9784FA|nr:DUF3750 domain-containing protein [Arenibaculum pallidiluteum]
MKIVFFTLLLLAALLAGPAYVLATGIVTMRNDWATAHRGSAGLAPDPAKTREAVVQLYAARAFSWRGAFGVHPWFAVKPEGADEYTVYELIGWRAFRGLDGVVVRNGTPDPHWFGQRPAILAELRGAEAAAAIPKIAEAAGSYPYSRDYRIWPGPNSNTFAAWVARAVPELRADLPSNALGKDYLGTRIVARAPSGTGWQMSLFGLLGILLAREEGIEVNVLGMSFGIDPLAPALRLPGIGRIGPGAWAENERN